MGGAISTHAVPCSMQRGLSSRVDVVRMVIDAMVWNRGVWEDLSEVREAGKRG